MLATDKVNCTVCGGSFDITDVWVADWYRVFPSEENRHMICCRECFDDLDSTGLERQELTLEFQLEGCGDVNADVGNGAMLRMSTYYGSQ